VLWLGIDLETSGLDANECVITEVGLVLWDTVDAKPVLMKSFFVDSGIQLTKEITELTGITSEMLRKYGEGQGSVCIETEKMMLKAEACVAHNAPFDRRFIVKMFEQCGTPMPEKLWIDTSADIPYPASITTRKLTHLAAEHGFVNPFPHRALTDVLTMLQIASKYPADTIMAYAQSPTVTILAKTTFEERELPKARGYRWDAGIKKWTKNVKEFQLEEETKNAPFSFEVRREQ
jgi:DNA polymerase-3 subunit epsilon